MIQRSGAPNQGTELRRKQKKSTEFQHDGLLDFRFIENVNIDT